MLSSCHCSPVWSGTSTQVLVWCTTRIGALVASVALMCSWQQMPARSFCLVLSAWIITWLLGQKKPNLSHFPLPTSLAQGSHTFSLRATENLLALSTLVTNVFSIPHEGEGTNFWQVLLITSHFLAQSVSWALTYSFFFFHPTYFFPHAKSFGSVEALSRLFMDSGLLFISHFSPSTAWFCMGVSPDRKQNISMKRDHYLPLPPPVWAPQVDLLKSAQFLAKYQISRNVKKPTDFMLTTSLWRESACYSPLYFLFIFSFSVLCMENSSLEEDLELVSSIAAVRNTGLSGKCACSYPTLRSQLQTPLCRTCSRFGALTRSIPSREIALISKAKGWYSFLYSKHTSGLKTVLFKVVCQDKGILGG